MEGLKINELISKEEKRRRDEQRRIIPAEQIKAMLDGKWPEFNGFNFDAVDFFKVEDGMLVPYEGIVDEDPIPGPNFMLFMVDDVSTAGHPVLIIPRGFKGHIKFK